MVSLKQLLSETNDQIKIYVDLDGVLANFPYQFQKLTGRPVEGFEKRFGTKKFWSEIEKGGVEFWSDMPWMQDGKLLWAKLISLPYLPEILSAPAKKKNGIVHDYSVTGKKIWVRKNLAQHIKVNLVPAQEKSTFATPTSILIDDWESNIKDWNSKSGRGILHSSAIDSIDKLLIIIDQLQGLR